jgi:aspartate aminotransferase
MNEVIQSIPPSVSLSITSKAKALAAAGENVCSFAAGEPDFDTPAIIKSAAAQALERGETKYTPVAGLLSLREAIVEKLKKENGLAYTPDQIIVSDGAKHSLFNVFMAICAPGDEVLIPAPYWLSYPEMVKIAGGVPVVVPTEEARDFKVTPEALEAAITDRTRAVVINSPSNPIGVVYTGEDLKALADVAVKHDILIISDEIYEKMVYDGVKHVSIGSFGDDVFSRTITVNGFSKAFSMTGWRLGYFAAPLPIVKTASTLQSHSTSGPNTFAQFGGIAALTSAAADVEEMVTAFAERRIFLYEKLTASPASTRRGHSTCFRIYRRSGWILSRSPHACWRRQRLPWFRARPSVRTPISACPTRVANRTSKRESPGWLISWLNCRIRGETRGVGLRRPRDGAALLGAEAICEMVAFQRIDDRAVLWQSG